MILPECQPHVYLADGSLASRRSRKAKRNTKNTPSENTAGNNQMPRQSWAAPVEK